MSAARAWFRDDGWSEPPDEQVASLALAFDAAREYGRRERIEPGSPVTVTLPDDIAPWWDESAYGATWPAVVVGVNGDSIDVTTTTGDVEPVDAEYVTPR